MSIVIHDIIIRYGESIWPGTSPRQTESNIGNLEPDLLAGEGGWVANRVGQSEVKGKKRASISCSFAWNWLIPRDDSTLDGTWIVATTSRKSLWQRKASETTWPSHQIYHWLSWVFKMQFPWLNLTKDFACETTAIKPSFCARLGFEVMLYFSQQWEHNNSQPTTTNHNQPNQPT